LAILLKHTFSNDTDLFSIARAAKGSHVLRIPTDIGVKFSLGEHVLEQEYDDILGQFPVDRRETLEAREKTGSLFRVSSSGLHNHLATDYNTMKCDSAS